MKRSRASDEALAVVYEAGARGVTWKELSRRLGTHHGSASGALSRLHRMGTLARLQAKRDGCAIYVVTADAGDRPTAPYRPVRRPEPEAAPDPQPMMDEAYNRGYKAGKEDAAEESWLIGYDAAKTEVGDQQEAAMRAMKVSATRVISEMYRVTMTHTPLESNHDTMCWTRHVGCALKAAMKAVDRA